MQNVNLSQVNQKYIINKQNTTSNPIEAKQSTEQIKDGNNKMKKALAGLAIAGAVIAVGVGIYKGVIKPKNAIEQITDITQDGIGKLLKENDKLTGKFQKTMEDGSKVIIEYTDGITQKSTKTASDGTQIFEKVYSKASNGDLLVNNKNITEISRQARKHQDDFLVLMKKKDVSLDELQGFDRSNLSQKQINELDLKINTKQEAIKLEVKKAKELAEQQAKKAEELAKKQACEAQERATKEVQRGAQKEAQDKALEKIDEFSKSLNGKSEEELSQLLKNINEEIGSINKRRDIHTNSIQKEDISRYNELQKKDTLCRREIRTRRIKYKERLFNAEPNKKVKTNHFSDYTSKDEQRAIESYYDDFTCNFGLRSGNIKDCDLEKINLMDSAFRKAPALESDAVVYRCIGNINGLDSITPGYIMPHKGYVSTSANLSNIQFDQFINNAKASNGLLMKIKVPKGTKGIYGGIEEFILPRGTQIKINSINIVDGYKVADCEYILPN